MTYREIYEEALWDLEHNNITLGEFDEMIKPLNQEVRKTGHWILADEQNEADVRNDNYRYICSGCGHSDIQSKSVTVPYCWYCGAKMEGE